MKTATITELKNQLSSIIDRVRAGESVLVTDRGQPVVRIEPVGADADDDARLARLERTGVVRKPSAAPPGRADPISIGKGSAIDVLLDERRSGR
jgi:prevent-host-death family protein